MTTDAFVEREAITVILSDKGWIRAMRGTVAAPDELRFKEGDRLKLLLPCFTTDRLTLFATNGRAYTLKAADVPRGRGDGQPVRIIADLSNEDDVVALFVPLEGAKYLVASSSGRGFVVPAGELGAEKRTGKQVLNLKPGEEAALCVPVEGDHVAVVGTNRRLLVFPLDAGAGDGARRGGHSAALQGWRAVGRAGVPAGGGAELEERRAGADGDQSAGLARRARAGRAAAAERVPKVGEVWVRGA